jgi:hypothetical protein
MALTFPNRSRSFDETRNAVRFVGYDGMFEVRFVVPTETLTAGRSSRLTETDSLAAFDAARNAVYEAAQHAYAHGRIALTPADFR